MRPTTRRTALGLRLLGVLAAGLLLLGLVLLISRDRADDPGDPPVSMSDPDTGAHAPPATPSDGVADDVTADLALLDGPDAAASGSADDLRRAVRAVAAGAWGDEAGPWLGRLVALAEADDLPLYVGSLVWDGATGRADGDVVVLAGSSADRGDLVLRFLPGADVLASAGSDVRVRATQAGQDVDVRLDGGGATLTVEADAAQPIRLQFSYVVPQLDRIVDDGGRAGFGLLARTGNGAMLGHWLPLLTFDPEPMVEFGDVGAFPPAVFSVEIQTSDVVVTGGTEGPCLVVTDGCTRGRGVGLRDLAVATFLGDPQSVTRGDVRATGRANLAVGRVEAIVDESAAAHALFEETLGPLPWPVVDVALLPLRAAAGMEFPGLVVVDPEYLDRLDGGFGTFVAVHEVAHQWFHALVGNSSLSDAVVDESLAQYLSYWFYADEFGNAAADGLFDRYLVGRYRSARQAGMVDIAPASPLPDFDSDDAYGPLVYGRAPLAWTVAEAAVGREVVRQFLVGLVADRGLEAITAREVVERARDQDPALAAVLERWWFDPAPVDDELR